MAILEIVKVPDPVLRKIAQPVRDYNPELEKLAKDMAETMYSAPGIGLAGNQVGVMKRIAVVDVSPPEKPKNLLVLINPEIVQAEGEDKMEEGCLSVPDFRQKVPRAYKIRVRARNLKGEEVELEAEGLLARVIQHELDHLDARLILDYASPIQRELYLRKRKKLLRRF